MNRNSLQSQLGDTPQAPAEPGLGASTVDNENEKIRNQEANAQISGEGALKTALMQLQRERERRIEMEAQLREAELGQLRLRTAFESARLGLCEATTDGRFRLVNDFFCKATGYTRDELLTMSVAELTHPDEREISCVQIKRVVDGLVPFYRLEKRYLQKGGEILWVDVVCSAIRDEGGTILALLGVIQDVTERRRAVDGLRLSERRYRSLALATGGVVWVANPSFEHSGEWPSWTAYTGQSSVEFQRRGWENALSPQDLPRLLADWERARRGKNSIKSEIRIRRCDGEFRRNILQCVPVFAENGAVLEWVGSTIDVEEQRQAEESLRHNEAQLRLVMDHAPVYIAYCDADRRLRFYTRAYAERFAPSPEKILGQLMAEVIGATAYESIKHGIDEVLTGVPVQFEAEISFETIGRRYVHCSYVPDLDAINTVRGFVVVISDITDQKRAETQIKNLNLELEHRVHDRTVSLKEAVSQLEEFSYTISHDVRAPLRAMRGYAEALVEDYGKMLDVTANDYLHRIIRASHRLDKLTLDVLAYSRTARDHIQLTSVNLDSLVKDIVQLQASNSPLAQIQVEDPLPSVWAHEALLMQCISNLLDNALKFVPPQRSPIVRIWSECVGKDVRLCVEDNGIGIKPEHHERIFEIFEQIHSDAGYKGTGIGLAIVRKAVERMNGEVRVESVENHGSRFWLTFQAA